MCAPSKGKGEGSVPDLSLWSLPLSVFSLCLLHCFPSVCLCPNFSFYMGTSHIGLQLTS